MYVGHKRRRRKPVKREEERDLLTYSTYRWNNGVRERWSESDRDEEGRRRRGLLRWGEKKVEEGD